MSNSNTCAYCDAKELSKKLHFICEACGVGMCDECYNAKTEHIYHHYLPIKSISPNMEQALQELSHEQGVNIMSPEYLCDECEQSTRSYLPKNDITIPKEILSLVNTYLALHNEREEIRQEDTDTYDETFDIECSMRTIGYDIAITIQNKAEGLK